MGDLAMSDYAPVSYGEVLLTVGALLLFGSVMVALTYSMGALDRWLYTGNHRRQAPEPEVNGRRDITVWQRLDDQDGWELADARQGGGDR